jgi:hypothetical protein
MMTSEDQNDAEKLNISVNELSRVHEKLNRQML